MANTKVTGDLIASGTITAANLVSGTLDTLLNGYLTTNSYATESYVTTAVSNLIDAAPASLDTLNELAAALNDDANFATTVTDSIATKLPLAGGNITGNLSVDTHVLFVDTVNDRVGIGTSSPSGKLTVNGASTPSSTPSGTFQITNLGGGTPTQINMGVLDSSPFHGWIQTQHQTLSGFYYSLLLNPQGGNVGIGTSSPTHNLTVGSTAASDFVVALRGGVGGFFGWDDSANSTILQSPNTRSLAFQVNSDTF